MVETSVNPDHVRAERGLAFVAVICLVVILSAGATSFFFPLNNDLGSYLAVADRLIHGEVLYRDVVEVKGPLSFVPYVAMTLVFGRGDFAVRAFDAVWMAGTLFVMWRLVRSLGGDRRAAWLSCAGFASVYYSMGFWCAQPDWYATILLLLSTDRLVAWSSSAKTKHLVVAGLLSGTATGFKYLALLYALFASLVLLLSTERDIIQRFKNALVFWAAWLAPIVLVVAYFALNGALADAREVVLGYVLSGYAAQGKFSYLYLPEVLYWRTFGKSAALSATGLAGIIGALFARTRERTFAVALVLATAGMMLAQSHSAWAHIVPVLASLAVFAGPVVSHSLDQLRSLRSHSPAALAAAGVIALVALAGFGQARLTFDEFKKNLRGPGQDVERSVEIVEYLRAVTEPGERVCVWGMEPLVPYLADRMSWGRFVYDSPLSMRSYGALQQRWRREFVERLRTNPPARLVICPTSDFPHGGYPTDTLFARWPEFKFVVDSFFVRDTAIGDGVVLIPSAGY